MRVGDGHARFFISYLASPVSSLFPSLLGLNLPCPLFGYPTNALGAVISFIYSWKLTLLSFFVAMPLGLFAGYYRFKYELEFNKLYEAVFAESSKWASESIGAIRTVSSLTLEDAICQRYQVLLDGHVTSAIKKARCVIY